MQWVAFGDGWQVDSGHGSPDDVPPFGVLVIAQADPDRGRILLHGCHYYVRRGGEWLGIWDWAGLVDFLAHEGGRVWFGRTVSDSEYRIAMRRAAEDERLPPMSAVTKDERRWIE